MASEPATNLVPPAPALDATSKIILEEPSLASFPSTTPFAISLPDSSNDRDSSTTTTKVHRPKGNEPAAVTPSEGGGHARVKLPRVATLAIGPKSPMKSLPVRSTSSAIPAGTVACGALCGLTLAHRQVGVSIFAPSTSSHLIFCLGIYLRCPHIHFRPCFALTDSLSS
jgi:hypothetical protein